MNGDYNVVCDLCRGCTGLHEEADGNCLYESVKDDKMKMTVDILVQYKIGCVKFLVQKLVLVQNV